MITRRGWLLLAGAVGLVVAGRLFGIAELYVLATAAVVLTVAAIVSVRTAPLALHATRTLHPAKVHAGTDSRVDLTVRNRSARTLPVVAVRDPFDEGRRQARFLLAPLAPGETARAAYRLPTERRGIYRLGPLELSTGDPFGLARRAAVAAAATQLTVLPRLDLVAPLPHTLGHDPYARADHPNVLGQLGEDFYALRPYQVGDDLRRVHWPSTARLDELMIRQDELPWQGRATVLLDVRRRAHTAESLELAVSAAASILTACVRYRALVRLVTTDGLDSGFGNGTAHVDALMEHLATVKADRRDLLPAVLGSLRRSGNGGALAAVTAAAPDDDLEGIARLQARFGEVTLVVFEPSSYRPGPPATGDEATPAPGTNVVRVTGARPFAVAWNEAMAARSGRRTGAGR